jgi:hypothetical protein
MHDGSLTAERYLPYPLRAGEVPRVHEAICCSTCPHRREPPEEVLALRRLGIQGAAPATVLHVAHQDWQDRCRTWLAPEVVPSCAMPILPLEQISDAIRRTGAKVVVLHRLCVAVAELRTLADQFPATAFVALFHGSQNNLLTNPAWVAQQLAFLRLSAERQNVWYATPERSADLSRFGWRRAVHWPNALAYQPIEPATAHQPPRLMVAGRLDVVKGIPAAVLAAGLVNQQIPCELLVCAKDPHRIKPLAELADVPFVTRPWTDQAAFRRMIRQDVTVTLHPSLTDACPQVPWDSLSQGRPVIGSPCVRFLDARNQPDPNDPRAIADATLACLDRYEAESARALQIADAMSRETAAEYRALIERLTNGPT